MTPEHKALIHGYLDGILSEAQEQELNDWVKVSPVNAVMFADAMRLHDQLRNRFRRDVLINQSTPWSKRMRWTWVGVAAGVALALLAVVWLFPTPASAAEELEKLIDRVVQGDRTYRISTLDSQPEVVDDRRPPINGAILSVRSPDHYVLIRRFPDGRLFVTGSDGERSWSIPPEPNRPVRVSKDPMRFRGPIPGNQQGIPFADLRSDLVEFREAYTITKIPTESGLMGLRAEKKSREHRGANVVELRFDPASGVIHQMTFHSLPRNRGGPEGVSVELVDQRDLDPDFFTHQKHHDLTRKIVEEE